jgi:uncharacterized protein YpmB
MYYVLFISILNTEFSIFYHNLNQYKNIKNNAIKIINYNMTIN